MFGSEFFPTPKHVVLQMLEPYIKKHNTLENYGFHSFQTTIKSLENSTILEPSAGKGDILDVIDNEICRHHKPELYCIEQNNELQFILQEKGYKVIHDDFLSYTGDYYFDLILMNPPFSNGDEHLLKAWDILKEGDICCLLNAETINNPHTQRRKLLANIIEQHGMVEHLGSVFEDAERETGVHVCMVRLSKKQDANSLDFEFETVTSEKHFKLDEEILKNPLATRDVVGNMILQYDKLKESFVDYLRVMEQLTFYSQGLIGNNHRNVHDILKKALDAGNDKKGKYNKFCDGMKQEIWGVVLRKLNIEKYMTHKVRENFQKFSHDKGALDFTKENVANLVNMIFENRTNILEQAIKDVFDIFTKYHKENRSHVEGWKTNDKWKVNRRIVLPYGVKWGEYMNAYDLKRLGDKFKVCYSKKSEYSDIDKVMCYLTGIKFDSAISIEEALDRKFEIIGNVGSGSFDNTCESAFFKIKFFKKGTIHLEFKDIYLWQEFNMRACAGKNWLPETERQQWEASKKNDCHSQDNDNGQLLLLAS